MITLKKTSLFNHIFSIPNKNTFLVGETDIKHFKGYSDTFVLEHYTGWLFFLRFYTQAFSKSEFILNFNLSHSPYSNHYNEVYL